MINICVTTYNRVEMLRRCIESIKKCTKLKYTLTVIDDASNDSTRDYLLSQKDIHVLLNDTQRGLAHNLNAIWEYSEKLNNFEYMCYIQDDVIAIEDGWLSKVLECADAYKNETNNKIGFLSAVHLPAHPVVNTFKHNNITYYSKKSISGVNMIAKYSFWNSIGKVPLVNNNGTIRGFPSPSAIPGKHGKGSNVDVYLTGCISKSRYSSESAKNSCYNQNATCIVVPTAKHIGINNSTWGNIDK